MLRILHVLFAICDAGSTTRSYQSESTTQFELFPAREEMNIRMNVRKKRIMKEYKKEERMNMRMEGRNKRRNGIM